MPTTAEPIADAGVCVTDRRRRERRTDRPKSGPKATRSKSAANPKAASDADSDDRRTQDRRRQIDPTTCERDYKPDEIEFMTAMDDYKRRSGRPFPTWSEVLEVLRDLGYRKVATPTQTYTGET